MQTRTLNFSSGGGNEYVYDDCSGMIVPLQSISADAYRKAAGLNQGRSSACFGKGSTPIKAEDIRKYIESNSYNQLTLELTARCNFRCEYCIYGDHYPSTRSFKNRDMDIHTAKRAVDYYMAKVGQKYKKNPNVKPTIGFYGGEPLLRFELLKQIVDYAESAHTLFPEILYTITTNGSLLSRDTTRFLVEHGFSIIVSLDGYGENHDRNRRFYDGSPTFETVYRNIKDFQADYPGYAKFGISACYDYRTDLLRMNDFVKEEKLFIVKLSQVSETNTDYYDRFTQEERQRFASQYAILKREFFESLRLGTFQRDSLLFPLFGTLYAEFSFHPMIREHRPEFSPYTSACVPGDKIYVTADGVYHMCERVPQDMPIGDIERGLDFNAIASIVSRYNEKVCGPCSSCAITRLCGLCYAVTRDGNDFTRQKGYCGAAEIRARAMLSDLVGLQEKNPGILEDITVEYYRTVLEKVGHFVE